MTPNDRSRSSHRTGGHRRRRSNRAPAESAPIDAPADDVQPEADEQAAPEEPQAEAPADNQGDDQPAAASAPIPSAPAGDNDLHVPADKVVVIGITGEPGCGKSSLAKEFARLGAQAIDVDAAGHEVIEGPATKQKLVEAFGDGILDADGAVDRRKLADKAFADADSVAALNRIVHPRLTTRVKTAAKKLGNFVVIDAALLHELGLQEVCTLTVYVRVSRENRLARLQARGWDDAELARREAALGDAEARRRACQLTVDNSGDPALLATFAKTILARQLGIDLKARAAAARAAQPPPPPPAAPVAAPLRDEPRPAPVQAAPAPVAGNGMAPPAQPAPYQPQPQRDPVKVDLDTYLVRSLPDLQLEAEKLEVRDVRWLQKHDLICEILRRAAGGRLDEIIVQGFIEPYKDQHAYLRSPLSHYLTTSCDTFISGQQLRRYGLKPGMHMVGTARAPRGNERCPQLLTIKEVMGEPIENRSKVERFEDLTALHANERLFMERSDQPDDYNLRIIDLVCPIGKGQRGLIVSQPKCGKTVFMHKIANAITRNNPEVVLLVLLVDERPEEVTDMQRSVKGEVIASTFDQVASRHVQCAELTINKAKRLVEQGKDVVILLDSITRLARAYNTESPGSGRVMSGGIEAGALVKPRQFFAAARKLEEGGSLTILASCLVDTGSVMDQVIFEEFKGTGNMELVLDRRLADRRIFPAINIPASGTRKDELLVKDPEEMRRLWALRRFLAERSPQDAVEFLKGKLSKYKSNVEFLMHIDPDRMSTW